MAEDKKKKSLFGRMFGRKSDAKKRAVEAAARAAEQELVDGHMATRMAAINAAALESAREQDLRDAGIDPEMPVVEEAGGERETGVEAERLEDLNREREDRAHADKAARKAAERTGREQPDRDSPDAQRGQGFFERISGGLRKSAARMSGTVAAAFTRRRLDDAAIEDLEDLLVAADFGIGPASRVTALLSRERFDKHVTDMEIRIALADVISDILTPLEAPLVPGGPSSPQILMFVGVNGSGKTTTLGKIAKRFSDQGRRVLIVAADTFRAAAAAQLEVWGERAGAPVMSAGQGADAAGLVYDSIRRARDEGFDVLMIDTAGRLQNRTELMDELAKIVRVIKKHDPSAPHHSILVLDATVGQNALSQAEAFKNAAGVTGLVMTKLDGTAKGGVLVALSDAYRLPIHYIGIGEDIEDLEIFSAPVFAATLSGVADAMA